MNLYDETATQKRSVFVSAGHSDTDPGAAANGTTEADIVLELRDLVVLELAGVIEVATDGQARQNMPLRDAYRMAAKHDIAVEFHCNAATPAATGAETLSKTADYPLAQRLLDATCVSLGIRSRGTKPENSGQHSRLAFVSDGGGIILELFFITNTADLASYHANKVRLAAALADVLIEEACREG